MRNYSLDALKFVCAFLVVFIHVMPPYYVAMPIDPLRRCAVPLFFMISGYFTYGRSDMGALLCKRMVAVFKIFCWAFLFYSLVYIVPHGWQEYIFYFKMYIIDFLCYNSTIYGWHLWYLHAYLYVLAIVWCVDRCKLYKYLFLAIPFLIIAAVLLGKYHVFLGGSSLPLCVSRNFFFTGLPFFALGMLLKRYEALVCRYIRLLPALLLVALFYAMGLGEIYALGLFFNNGDLYISTAFMSIALFVLFLNFKLSGDNIISKIGREDSLYIYVFHLFVSQEICYQLFKGSSLMAYYPYFSALIVFVVTLLFIRILRRLKIVGNLI
jgi:surface polysaccharide O-acyltransferase-like enzyme